MKSGCALALQPKLLRALEQKEVKRVRGNDLLLADVRILAATNLTPGPVPGLSPAALDVLISHDWPGNVRKLHNAIQRAVVMAESGELTGPDFSFLRQAAKPGAETESPSGLSRWEQAERTNILGELARQMGNKTKAARELGIAKSTLFGKLKKYEIRGQESERQANCMVNRNPLSTTT
jgi:DNA-binding NtrC family response regulator